MVWKSISRLLKLSLAADLWVTAHFLKTAGQTVEKTVDEIDASVQSFTYRLTETATFLNANSAYVQTTTVVFLLSENDIGWTDMSFTTD